MIYNHIPFLVELSLAFVGPVQVTHSQKPQVKLSQNPSSKFCKITYSFQSLYNKKLLCEIHIAESRDLVYLFERGQFKSTNVLLLYNDTFFSKENLNVLRRKTDPPYSLPHPNSQHKLLTYPTTKWFKGA